MAAVLIATDLMATSSAAGAARQAGVTLQTVAPSAVSEGVNAETRLVVIDLTAVAAGLAELVGSIRQAAPGAHVLAFGPHVQEQRLGAARDAGCDEVITRGQWHKGAEQLLLVYAADG